MLIILAIISLLTQYAIPKTIEDFPYQSNQTCDECYRIYVPLCASDNETYTNECRFRCIMSKKQVEDRARIVRLGPCILGERKKRFVNMNNFFLQEFA